jgi:hypothetical protein
MMFIYQTLWYYTKVAILLRQNTYIPLHLVVRNLDYTTIIRRIIHWEVEKSYRGKMYSLQHALCRYICENQSYQRTSQIHDSQLNNSYTIPYLPITIYIYIYIFIIAVIVDWYNSHSIVASTASSGEHVDQLDYYYDYYYYQWASQQRVVVVLIS